MYSPCCCLPLDFSLVDSYYFIHKHWVFIKRLVSGFAHPVFEKLTRPWPLTLDNYWDRVEGFSHSIGSHNAIAEEPTTDARKHD